MDDAITIYGPAFSSYVRSVRLCCEEKGVPYMIQERIGKNDWITINSPFQKVPVLKHGDFVLFESAAICRYIDRAFDGPPLSPVNFHDLARMDQWVSAANCYFDPAFIRRFVLEYAFPKTPDGKPDWARVKTALPDVHKHLGIAERALRDSDYFSGREAGIADYLIVPMIDYLARGGAGNGLLDSYPDVMGFLARMRARESGKKILIAPKMNP